ncbi:MAG: single-stranded DNA-binding protein [Prolixibacteraceae bacterium]|nr:single-stranded DNA-binding protein [Prolixibacteraceae bacterium]MBT6006022.1 single-stranded DNA-binding protein [Prolixibacteraceae bacterium]MBT6766555.1 single-stranded DNA-binding protein [Prolixibacteraceae bacterium]MBT6997369.1 single-stranded DNA-binding protein [Prolixibacteraceae bacterium]MBT7394407.1 single-stranded DNA-binding protein [Prolixibacteraceae bacterium]
MMSVNKVILVGNVGKDPEVRHLDSGVAVASFPFATSESYTKNGERVTTTEWHNIVLWRGLAEVAEKYVKKGSKLFLEGKIATRQYEKDGQTKYFTEIVVNNMVMLDSKNAASPAENKDNSNQEPKAASTVNEPDTEDLGGDEDLPF